MKVIGINGSGRKDGNTALLIKMVFKELEEEGIETEMVQLAGSHLHGCAACYSCFRNRDWKCVLTSDCLNDIIRKMADADGIILGSPVYVSYVTAEMKALMDRATMVSLANDFLFPRKVGAAVVAVRRAGSIHTFDTMNHFFLINQMIIPGSSYWNVGVGRNIGEVEDDQEAHRTMKNLGRNMAWLLKKIED